MAASESFHEARPFAVPLREMGLSIHGTWLEPLLADFDQELERAGISRVKPRFYLANEWGVSDSLAIGIPFYLARHDLIALQAERVGHVEGDTPSEILRYLRHEMGHVICYAYRLHDEEEWVRHFGSNTQPYLEEFRLEPFSRSFVIHLPGWYAQKHPEEDWAETFAVWMTPGLDWRTEYGDWPEALGKLEYCDRVSKRIGDQEPLATSTQQEDDISEYEGSIEQFYEQLSSASAQHLTLGKVELPPGLDGALKAIFEDLGAVHEEPHKPASTLIMRMERDLLANVYRWTGLFPERARPLIRHLAERADRLNQVYLDRRELPAAIAFTTLVTSLAMNYVHRGTYLP